jgi:hypothetical protein
MGSRNWMPVSVFRGNLDAEVAGLFGMLWRVFTTADRNHAKTSAVINRRYRNQCPPVTV